MSHPPSARDHPIPPTTPPTNNKETMPPANNNTHGTAPTADRVVAPHTPQRLRLVDKRSPAETPMHFRPTTHRSTAATDGDSTLDSSAMQCGSESDWVSYRESSNAYYDANADGADGGDGDGKGDGSPREIIRRLQARLQERDAEIAQLQERDAEIAQLERERGQVTAAVAAAAAAEKGKADFLRAEEEAKKFGRRRVLATLKSV